MKYILVCASFDGIELFKSDDFVKISAERNNNAVLTKNRAVYKSRDHDQLVRPLNLKTDDICLQYTHTYLHGIVNVTQMVMF